MAPIAPRARCGLPSNPRQWLLEKKPVLPTPKSSIEIREPSEPQEHHPRDIPQVKSPLRVEDYEDLLDCYSTDQKPQTILTSSPSDYKPQRALTSSPSIPSEANAPSSFSAPAGYHKPPTPSDSPRPRPEDHQESKSSLGSDRSGIKVLTTDSYGGSFTRKRRNFPVNTPLKLFQIPPFTTKTALRSPNRRGGSVDSWVDQLNLVNQKSKLKESPELNGAEHISRLQALERTRKHSVPETSGATTAVSDTDPSKGSSDLISSEGEAVWDESDLLEAYSSLDSEGSSRDSYLTHYNTNDIEVNLSLPKISSSQTRKDTDLDQNTYDLDTLSIYYHENGLKTHASATSDSSHYSIQSHIVTT